MSDGFVQLMGRMGDNINRIRVEADVTQAELSERSGVSKSFIGGIEIATTNRLGEPVKVPTIRTLWRIAEVLDCDVADFFEDGTTSEQV